MATGNNHTPIRARDTEIRETEFQDTMLMIRRAELSTLVGQLARYTEDIKTIPHDVLRTFTLTELDAQIRELRDTLRTLGGIARDR